MALVSPVDIEHGLFSSQGYFHRRPVRLPRACRHVFLQRPTPGNLISNRLGRAIYRWVGETDAIWPLPVQRSTCQCEHNTCGDQCDRCCPLFNQQRWSHGTSEDGAACQQCQCYGHADACQYDPLVERDRRSLNVNNVYQGGGVCTNCSVIQSFQKYIIYNP